MKRCPDCGITSDNYHSNSSRKDGLQTYCRPCQTRRSVATRDREKGLACSRAYYLRDPEKQRQRIRDWHLAHPGYYKEWYAKNRDVVNGRRRKTNRPYVRKTIV